MELADAVDFARGTRQSVLTKIRSDGRPQLSNVFHHLSDDGLIRVSITADRAKYANLVRDPRASLHIARADFWAYVVLEGDADVAPVAAAPNDARPRRYRARRACYIYICSGRAGVADRRGR